MGCMPITLINIQDNVSMIKNQWWSKNLYTYKINGHFELCFLLTRLGPQRWMVFWGMGNL